MDSHPGHLCGAAGARSAKEQKREGRWQGAKKRAEGGKSGQREAGARIVPTSHLVNDVLEEFVDAAGHGGRLDAWPRALRLAEAVLLAGAARPRAVRHELWLIVAAQILRVCRGREPSPAEVERAAAERLAIAPARAPSGLQLLSIPPLHRSAQSSHASLHVADLHLAARERTGRDRRGGGGSNGGSRPCLAHLAGDRALLEHVARVGLALADGRPRRAVDVRVLARVRLPRAGSICERGPQRLAGPPARAFRSTCVRPPRG